MAQKFKKLQNTNDDSTAFGKWFATAVYDQHFITTEELAEFIQTQASVKKSDIKAVLDELGAALKHFFELGQKVKHRTSPPAACCSSLRRRVWSSARPGRTVRSSRSSWSSRRW